MQPMLFLTQNMYCAGRFCLHFPSPESPGATIFNTAINSVVKQSHYKANSAFVLIVPVDWNIGHMVEGDGYWEK